MGSVAGSLLSERKKRDVERPLRVVCKALARRQWRRIAILTSTACSCCRLRPSLRLSVSWQMRWRSDGAFPICQKRSKARSRVYVGCAQSELVSELAGKEEVMAGLQRQLTEARAHAEVSAAFAFQCAELLRCSVCIYT